MRATDHIEYTLSEHWLVAIVNDDHTGLSNAECRQLDGFLERLPCAGTWAIDEELGFTRDEISGLWADCVNAKFWWFT